MACLLAPSGNAAGSRGGRDCQGLWPDTLLRGAPGCQAAGARIIAGSMVRTASVREAVHYLRDRGVRRATRRLVRTYLHGQQRMHLTHADLAAMARRPVKAEGVEVRLVEPGEVAVEDFPDLAPSTAARWSRPGYFWFVALHMGRPAAYRVMARTVTWLVTPFLRLLPHELFVVDDYTHPDFRRRGIIAALRVAAARHLVARGFRESWATESPTNYATLSGTDRTGIERSTLIRRCVLGRVRFEVTPAATLSAELVARQVRFLRQLVPGLSRVGLLLNPSVTRGGPERLEAARAAVAGLGADLALFEMREAPDQMAALERVFASMRETALEGLLVLSDPMLRAHRRAVVSLVERHRLPAVYDASPFVDAGGLMAYGSPPPCLHDIESLRTYLEAQARTPLDGPALPADLEPVVSRHAASRLGLALPATVQSVD